MALKKGLASSVSGGNKKKNIINSLNRNFLHAGNQKP